MPPRRHLASPGACAAKRASFLRVSSVGAHTPKRVSYTRPLDKDNHAPTTPTREPLSSVLPPPSQHAPEDVPRWNVGLVNRKGGFKSRFPTSRSGLSDRRAFLPAQRWEDVGLEHRKRAPPRSSLSDWRSFLRDQPQRAHTHYRHSSVSRAPVCNTTGGRGRNSCRRFLNHARCTRSRTFSREPSAHRFHAQP